MDGIETSAAPDITPDQPAPVEQAPPQGTSAETTPVAEDLFSPAPEIPEGEQVTPEWLQERHKQMQADYTKKRQADAETAKQRAEDLEFLESLRSDPDTQKAVFEQLQELFSGESDEGEGDPEGSAESDLERQVRELRESQQAREAQELTKAIVSHVEQLAKDASVELDEHDLREVFELATDTEKYGRDVTEKAFQNWHARQQAKQDKWLKSYLASKQAPAQVPAGSSATEAPDLSNRDERIKRMAARIQAQ